MTDQERLNQFKKSEFWQNVKQDATLRASRSDNWKQFDDPKKHFEAGAKENTRPVLVEWALNDLMNAYKMPMDYITVNEDISEGEELTQLEELKQRIDGDSKPYEVWKNGQ